MNTQTLWKKCTHKKKKKQQQQQQTKIGVTVSEYCPVLTQCSMSLELNRDIFCRTPTFILFKVILLNAAQNKELI
jgi:hypothetical protein